MEKTLNPAFAFRALEIGKAAEHLVCADLILGGHRAFLTDQGLPYDIVFDDKGRLFRVQVKATTTLRSIPQRQTKQQKAYMFHVRRAGKGGKRIIGNNEFDILALVALDIKVVAYLAISEKVLQTVHLRPPGVSNHNKSKGNIDQFPLDKALEALR